MSKYGIIEKIIFVGLLNFGSAKFVMWWRMLKMFLIAASYAGSCKGYKRVWKSLLKQFTQSLQWGDQNIAINPSSYYNSTLSIFDKQAQAPSAQYVQNCFHQNAFFHITKFTDIPCVPEKAGLETYWQIWCCIIKRVELSSLVYISYCHIAYLSFGKKTGMIFIC